MSLPFKTKFFLIVGFQLLLLVGLIAYRQLPLATGRSVLLETVPVDPRDLFRGDYVILDYTVSRIEQGAWRESAYRKGETVYVTLRQRGRYAEAEAVSRVRPGNGALFLRGTVADAAGDRLRVAYGIESYFVPEGAGGELERAAGRGLIVEAAVDRAGRAVVRRVRRER